MHTIFKDFSFSAAHSIRGHTRGCENLHGHNYRVRVHLRAARLDELGMVLDFADLKAIMQEVLGPFDHRVLNEVPPFDRRNTTAELLAEHVFAEVARRLPPGGQGQRRRGAGGPDDAGGGGDPSGTGEAGGTGGTGGMDGRGLAVTRVEVWENDSSCAAYEP